MLAKSTMQSLPFALANCTGMKCNGLETNEDDKIATKHNMQIKQWLMNSKYYLERAGHYRHTPKFFGWPYHAIAACERWFA